MNLTKQLIVRPGKKLKLAGWDAGETFGHNKESAQKLLEKNVTRLADYALLLPKR